MSIQSDHIDVSPNPSQSPNSEQTNFFQKILGWVKAHRWPAAAIGLTFLLIAVIGLTDLKYPVVGTVVKSQVELTVIDPEINQPILEATVKVGKISGVTNKEGKVTLSNVSPGGQSVEIVKKAYQSQTLKQKLKFGSNSLGIINLQITGVRLSFSVSNKVSNLALTEVKIQIGDASAVTDNKGAITLSVETLGKEKTTAKVSKAGYLSGELEVELKRGQKAFPVELVPEGKVYFLTNRNRRIDLMRSNLDGSAQEVVVAGTGSEDHETGILPNVKNPSLIAMLSSREGNRDEYGNLRHDLYVVNGETKKISKIHNDIGFNNYRAWSGDYLLYESITYGLNTKSSVVSYNSKTAKSITIAELPNDDYSIVMGLNLVVGAKAYYSVYMNGNDKGLYVSGADGSGKKRISDTPVDEIIRQSKNTVIYEYYSSPTKWRSLNLTTSTVTNLTHGPSTESERGYVDSPSAKYSSFVEERDGKSELYISNLDGSNEKRLTNGAKVSQFVQWYGEEYMVYSVTVGENALYIVALDGGTPVKITDFYRGNGKTYGGGYNPVY